MNALTKFLIGTAAIVGTISVLKPKSILADIRTIDWLNRFVTVQFRVGMQYITIQTGELDEPENIEFNGGSLNI